MSAPNSELAPILQRLERLERQNRTLKLLGLALAGLAGLGLLVAADNRSDKVMSAEQIVLKDRNGKARLMLANHRDQTGIVFFSPDGQQQAFLVSEPGGVALRYMRSDGAYTSGISCERGGVGLVGITDNGRNQTEVNAIIVPGKILLRDYQFPVNLNERK